jgi:hypothetical protein
VPPRANLGSANRSLRIGTEPETRFAKGSRLFTIGPIAFV